MRTSCRGRPLARDQLPMPAQNRVGASRSSRPASTHDGLESACERWRLLATRVYAW
jgi:hypothetical protein